MEEKHKLRIKTIKENYVLPKKMPTKRWNLYARNPFELKNA